MNTETGEQVWRAKLEDAAQAAEKTPVRGGPALTENGGTLLISSENGTLYALDTADGSRKWTVEGDGKGYVTPIVDGDMVYEGRIHGTYRVRALELLEGGDGYKELWVYPLESETGE